MNLFETVKQFLTIGNKTEVPENSCPNCWGRQEYSGKFYDAIQNEGIDINNLSEKKGWIEKYAEAHLGKIQLRKSGDDTVCESCKLQYKVAE